MTISTITLCRMTIRIITLSMIMLTIITIIRMTVSIMALSLMKLRKIISKLMKGMIDVIRLSVIFLFAVALTPVACIITPFIFVIYTMAR